jgi:hypothetical protein
MIERVVDISVVSCRSAVFAILSLPSSEEHDTSPSNAVAKDIMIVYLFIFITYTY